MADDPREIAESFVLEKLILLPSIERIRSCELGKKAVVEPAALTEGQAWAG
jgi:hypothetical protein